MQPEQATVRAANARQVASSAVPAPCPVQAVRHVLMDISPRGPATLSAKVVVMGAPGRGMLFLLKATLWHAFNATLAMQAWILPLRSATTTLAAQAAGRRQGLVRVKIA